MRSKLARNSACVLAATVSASLALLPLAQSAPAASRTSAPTVATGRVNDVRGTSAALLGTVNPHGLPTTYVFQYGPSITYGSQTPSISVGAGQSPVRVSQTVANLPLGSHYRIVAANSAGTRAGRDQSYTTVKRKLKFAMEDTKQLAPTPYGGTFVLQGTLTGIGGALQAISVQSSAYPYLTAFVDVGSSLTTNAAGAFSIPVKGLTKSTQLRVRTSSSRPLTSPIVTAQVAPRITLHVRTSSHVGLVRLYGTVTPAEVGMKVLFQVEEPSRPRGNSEREVRYAAQAFTTVKRATRSFSRFSQVVTVRKAGRYRAYVVLRTGALVSGASSSVTLRADPNTAKSH
jgi:hypothetical protein